MRRFFLGTILFLVFAGSSALAQSSEGKLTVSATVVTSVSLVIDPDGAQKIVIANAADPRDSVSTLLFAQYAMNHLSSNNPETSKIEGAAVNMRVTDPSKEQIRQGAAILYQRSVQCREY